MTPSLYHFVVVSTGSALLSWSAAAAPDAATVGDEPAFWQSADPAAPVDGASPDPFGVELPDSAWGGQGYKVAAGPPHRLRVHQVTFRVPADLETATRTDREGGDEGSLFLRLAEQSHRGDVRIVVDFEYGASGGHMADQQAMQVFSYPTEYEPSAAHVALAPTSFETRQLGTGGGLTPRLRLDSVRVDGGVSRVRWAGFSSWVASPLSPVADQPRSCLVRHPVILREAINGSSLLSHGAVQLIGVQPESSVPGSAQEVEAWLYTFLRVSPATPAGSPAGAAPTAEGDGVALELVAIRTACDEAARWLAEREPGNDDAADLAAWEKQAVTGAAAGSSRWVMRALTGPLRPGGPPRTTVESMGEFIYPTEFDPGLGRGKFFTPTAFETCNCGAGFSAQATWAADRASALVKLSFEDVALEEIEEWPFWLKEPLFHIEQPLFRTRTLATEVAVPVNGVRFIGIRTARSDAHGGPAEPGPDYELLFLKVRGTPQVIAPEARPAPPVVEAQAVVFSVPAPLAAQLAHESDEGRRVAALWSGQSAGEVKIIHLSAGATCVRGALETSDIFETIFPSEIEIETVTDDFIGLSAFETQNHGAELIVRPRLVGGVANAEVSLQWESAPSSRPTLEAYRRWCEIKKGDVPKPTFFQEEAVAAGAVVPMDGEWHILSFQECAAPETAPEHGRWHAAVVRVLDMDRR